jgi:coproporphyrinogen III oxidase
MESLIREKQMEIVRALEQLDGKAKFRIDKWQRPNDGGYGRTAVIEDGDVFERGGVNISIVQGSLPPAAVAKMKADHKSLQTTGDGNVLYWVCGLSLIMHPQNPMAPTVHLNYRYFETQNQDGSPQAWWFGGGTDLTPNYLFEDDVKEFHSNLKKACDDHDKQYYPKFKKWCDDYFYVKHRKERRGVGGIFFDDLADREPTQIYEFVKSSLNQFLPTYTAIINRRKDMPFNDKQREWQLIRRGRYVEFNLVHDRGTAFGLHAPGARIESILVSLPRNVMWTYNHAPEPGSEEDKLLEVLKNPKDWVE